MLNTDDIKEIENRLEGKVYHKEGETFALFGTHYKTCKGANCEDCAFFDCHCMLNIDIPACNNNVHFEVLTEKELQNIKDVQMMNEDMKIWKECQTFK